MSGFTKPVRDLVLKRAGGICEKCGQSDGLQYHHRRPRGMGGSKDSATNVASNCILLCRRCHELTEQRRERALFYGYLVRQGRDPKDEPVWIANKWVLLDDNGGKFLMPGGEGRCARCGFHVPTQGHRDGCQAQKEIA